MRDRDSPSSPRCSHPLDWAAQRDWQQAFLFFSFAAKFWRNEFISVRRSGLWEMKYNGGGPGAWWGDVSTEGKLLFVCLSLTLSLPFISLQGCGTVFTPGQLFFCFSLRSPPPPPRPSYAPFHAVLFLKSFLDDHQGLPFKFSSPYLRVLGSYPDSPSSASNSLHSDLLFSISKPVENA